MQFKGLTRFFTVALILISLYQLHLTFVVRHHENKLKKEAHARVLRDTSLHADDEKRRAERHVYRMLIDSMKMQTVSYGPQGAISYDKAKEQELNLGLDLQGGMNVTLDIDLGDMIKSMSNDPRDPDLARVIALVNKKKETVGEDYATLFYGAFRELLPQKTLFNYFSNFVRKQAVASQDDEAIVRIIRSESRAAIKRTYDILLTRIDQFGVAQPSVNLDLSKGIITVELAGNQEDPERIRKYLQATAKLQFWEVYSVAGMLEPLSAAERVLSAEIATQYKLTKKDKHTKNIKEDKTQTPKTLSGEQSVEDLLQHNKAQEGENDSSAQAAQQNNVFAQMLTQVQYMLQNAGQEHVSADKIPLIFQLRPQDTVALNRALAMPEIRELLPPNVRFFEGAETNAEKANAKQDPNKPNLITYYAIKTEEDSDEAKLEGDNVANAVQDFDERGRAVIRMTMTKVGEQIWADMTAANIGMPIAVTLDDKVYSAPRVNSAITGGVSEISGGFSVQEAQDLSNILRSGKLPAPAKIVQEQIVGPTLGQEAIIGGAKAFIISFFVIMLFMYIYYNTAGTIANIALILNILFTVGLLAALGATLTAPGIAGLVLTIGMAVDTNVIIFERIKEEIKGGIGYGDAIKVGYRRSLAPVLDAHVTTLLTAIILYYFGLGSIKGFATTQILGILLSLLCGILVSRQISDIWTKKNRHFNYFTPISEKLFQHAKFKFIEFRKYTYVISIAILILGIAAIFHGFDEGVEFKGGRSYTVRFDKTPHIDELRAALKEKFGGENPIIKTIGDNKTLNITTSHLIEKSGPSTDSLIEKELFAGLQKYLPADERFSDFTKHRKISSTTILPTISDDLKRSAVKATILALIVIFMYIFIRFRKWQYSLGTIVALFHDVLVTLIVFSFFRSIVPFPLEIDQHFVAAILTVIGFSMNDTVIVFDRIRETLRRTPHAENDFVAHKNIINKAINDTLSRTIMTALTVFITLVILFIFGGEVTRGFAFAMLIGVLVGTYSSIFVAAPILVDLDTSRKKRKQKVKA